MRKVVAVAVAAIALTIPAVAQEMAAPERAVSEVIPCREKAQSIRTPVLVSKTGARAYLEVTVGIADKKDVHVMCRAEWTLRVAQPGQAEFLAAKAFTYKEENRTTDDLGSDAALYYSGDVLGWSADGNLLLASATVAAYESWFQPHPLVYCMTTGEVSAVSLVRLFAGRAPNSWSLSYDVRGFTSDNKLLVAAESFEWAEPQDLFAKSTWTVDPQTEKLESAIPGLQAGVERLPKVERASRP